MSSRFIHVVSEFPSLEWRVYHCVFEMLVLVQLIINFIYTLERSMLAYLLSKDLSLVRIYDFKCGK